MQMTGAHHDEHQQNKQRRKHLRVHEATLLPFSLKAQQQLEQKHQQQLHKAPDGAKSARLVHAFDVLSYEHNNAEISVQAIADEQRHKHSPPGHVERLVQLEDDHDREKGDGNEVHKHLEHRHTQPSGQLL